jgi:OOP family OmpA-OmpF porin
MHNRQLRFLTYFLATALVLAIGVGTASAKVELIRKADSFVMFIDHSGSMGFKHGEVGERKIKLAKQIATAMNDKIPALGYEGGVATYAPFAELWKGAHGKSELASAVAGINEEYQIFGRTTPMGDGLSSLSRVLDGMPGKIAVILFADGESNRGSDPVAEAD